MIRLIEQTLASAVTGLGFIGRYGGMVTAVTVQDQNEAGNTVNKTFPVSCYVSATDCFDGGKYMDLVPDDQYASVAYFEQRGGANIETSGPNRREWNASEALRFVCWLNYPKLGLADCKGADRFAFAFMNAILKPHTINTDGLTGRLDITRAVMVERDFRSIFGRYSYSDKQWAFFWPYDYFAVDFTARVTLTGACVEDVTLGDPVTCVTTY